MKITLLEHTRNAKELLIFTKGTRLNMAPCGLDEIHAKSEDWKTEQLEYMSNTIKSSWEMVDYVFMIEDVTRAFTHQLVRNRQGSYAQQTMRVLNKSGFTYGTGPSINGDARMKARYDYSIKFVQENYDKLISAGAEIEDARGILPTNIHTNIVAKYNLRTMSELVAARSSVRTQGEYRDVLSGMIDAILDVHPWAHMFLKDQRHYAAEALASIIQSEYEGTEMYIPYMKLVDQLR